MTKITVKDKDYILKITTKQAINMEDDLGFNPINALVRMKYTNELPKLKDLLIILHYSLQKFNHGMSFMDTMNLYDNYLDEGGSMASLLEVIIKAFEESGLVRFEEDPEA